MRGTAPTLKEMLVSWVIFNYLLFKTLYLEEISNLQKRIRLGQRLHALPVLLHLLYHLLFLHVNIYSLLTFIFLKPFKNRL